MYTARLLCRSRILDASDLCYLRLPCPAVFVWSSCLVADMFSTRFQVRYFHMSRLFSFSSFVVFCFPIISRISIFLECFTFDPLHCSLKKKYISMALLHLNEANALTKRRRIRLNRHYLH